MYVWSVSQVLHCNVDPWVSTNGTKEVIKANTTFVRWVATLVQLIIIKWRCAPHLCTSTVIPIDHNCKQQQKNTTSLNTYITMNTAVCVCVCVCVYIYIYITAKKQVGCFNHTVVTLVADKLKRFAFFIRQQLDSCLSTTIHVKEPLKMHFKVARRNFHALNVTRWRNHRFYLGCYEGVSVCL